MRWMLDSDPNEQVVRVPTRGQVSMMPCINLDKAICTKYADYVGTSKWLPYLQR